MREEAYFVLPESGSPGPGVLLLYSWWGLTPALRQRADRLSEAGMTVLAPDLTFGVRPETVHDPEEMLADLDVDAEKAWSATTDFLVGALPQKSSYF